MEIIIRPEMPADHFENENVTREAFWNLYIPGCNEHVLVHKLRRSAAMALGSPANWSIPPRPPRQSNAATGRPSSATSNRLGRTKNQSDVSRGWLGVRI